LLATPEGAERLFVIVQPISFLVLLLSCSSLTFSNLTEAFAVSHRFLFVCALTRPWVGTTYTKQDACHRTKKSVNQWDMKLASLPGPASRPLL
jgi:hypothetical protein